MKIDEILSESGNAFSARIVREHCGHTAKLTSGYHDDDQPHEQKAKGYILLGAVRACSSL